MKYLMKLRPLKASQNQIRVRSFLIACGFLLLSLSAVRAQSQSSENYVCPQNADPLYQRKRMFAYLARMLEESVPEYKRVFPAGFGTVGDRPRAFFVYDLSDPLNNKTNSWSCVQLANHHVYHVAPVEAGFSFSHIVVLEGGKFKVFKSLNCRNRGDSLESVLTYLDKTLENNKDKQDILNRVKKYREFGVYSSIDNDTPSCDY
jgi:hypothetical protein